MQNISIKNNFLDFWLLNKNEDNWNIYENESLLCLKSPIDCPRLQLCWGINSIEDINKIYEFTNNKSFGYFEEESNPLSFRIPHDIKVPLIEMKLEKADYMPIDDIPDFKIKIVENKDELDLWIDLCHKTSGMKKEDLLPFVSISFKNNAHSFLIAKHRDMWLGCADIYIDKNKLGLISSVGVLAEYRNKGFGKSIMDKAISKIFESDGEYAALYAYQDALPFYNKIGFQETNKWNYYITKNKVF